MEIVCGIVAEIFKKERDNSPGLEPHPPSATPLLEVDPVSLVRDLEIFHKYTTLSHITIVIILENMHAVI